ncbi:hypothetical protein DPV78_008229 [Talaromyces pinophilus]|nr:hypothetical protein DPV78_008229 [Talaromyces pinophilus]
MVAMSQTERGSESAILLNPPSGFVIDEVDAHHPLPPSDRVERSGVRSVSTDVALDMMNQG